MSLQRRYKDVYTAHAGSAGLELGSVANLDSFFQKILCCRQQIDIFVGLSHPLAFAGDERCTYRVVSCCVLECILVCDG